jgi:PAS domain S-box-containing protein
MTPRESRDDATSLPDNLAEIAAPYRARIVELEQRLDDLTRLVSDLVWDIDADLRLTYISERVFDILGFIPRELLGKSILELGSFEDEAPISAPDVFRRAFRNRRFVILDKQSRAHTFRFSGIPVFDLESGAYLGARGTADDDTDRRAAEQALREGERRYRMLVEQSPHAMLVVGDDIRYANNKAAGLFRVESPRNLVGLHPRELVYPYDHVLVRNNRPDRSAAENGFEIRRLKRDGSMFHSLNFTVEIEWEDHPARLVTILDLTDYKDAQRALTESERRFRDFAQSAADRFWETDQNHRIIFTSAPRDRDVLWGEGGMMGRLRWSTPALDSDEPKWQDLRRDMEQHLPIRNFRYRVADSSRAVRYLRVNGVPVSDAAGVFIGYRGTAIDETAEVLARQEAEGIQHMLRLTTDSVPAFIGYHDRETRFRYANSYYKRMLGFETEKLIGKTIADVFGQDAAVRCEDYVRRALSGESVKYDAEFETTGGDILQTETNFIPDVDENGGVDGFFVMSLDITERKRVEQERERTRVALEAAQRLAHIGSFERTFEPEALYWTRELYHIHGLDPDGPPVTFDLFLQHIHPSDRARVQRVLDKATRNRQQAYSLEYRAVRPDGEERNVMASGEFTYDIDGAPLTLIGSIQDITAQKRIQAALERAKLDAEAANRAKTEFLSSMSHELRTPMNAVLGYAELLLQNKKEPISPRQQRQINQILKSGQHLLNLINDILDLSRIESGRVELAIKDLALDKIVGECLSLVEAIAGRNRISIQNLTRQKSPLVVHCDDVRLKQALVNLLSNAIKFNRTGGKVIVDQEERRDGMVRISIQDTGDGIAPSRHRELFEPFSRLDATQRGIEGTGIGLAISKQLIERMGGRIGFASEVGVGSTFWIDVPSATRLAGAHAGDIGALSESEPAFKLASGGLRKLLYVEDDESNLRLLEEVISHIPNLTLLAAPDAENGIRLACESRPDVIVMDINLPGMSGFEAIEKLKHLPETQSIPVIALSAAAMSKDIQKGAEAGFFAYLTKPFVIDELLNTIDRALDPAADAPVEAAQ